MTNSLRERRRQETARDIQRATLELAIAQCLEKTTAEAIAERAGVSARTFFNYYPNKEAAAIGTPPGFHPEAMATLRTGRGRLANDLKQFLDKHMAILASDETTLRMVRKVIHSNAKANSILDSFLRAERDDLTECLRERVSDEQVARALASNAVDCTSRAIQLWEKDESTTLDEALDIVWSAQIEAARQLAVPFD